MEIFRSSSRYIGPHHNILGPARFLPYESRGWRTPLFHFGGFHRPHFGGFRGFGGFGMSSYQQNVIIDNGRHGFWGGLADGLEGFVRGFMNVSWLMGGMQQQYNMYNNPMMMQQMPVADNQQAAQQNDNSNLEFNNLKKFADKAGYMVVKEQDGTYTAFNDKTKDHISGDYVTVRDAILGKDEPKADEPEEAQETQKKKEDTKPQGANDGDTVKAEEFKKYNGKSVLVTDELRIHNGEDPDLVNIKGKTTFGEMDKKTGYPATISVGNVKYTLSEDFKDDPKYKDATLYKSDKKGEYYRLEWKDGEPILVQHKGDKELGAGDVDVHQTKRK